MLGSIGVVAQLNFHRLLKKNDVDFEVLTAGEHKRTLTVFGENTDKGRQKFLETLKTLTACSRNTSVSAVLTWISRRWRTVTSGLASGRWRSN